MWCHFARPVAVLKSTCSPSYSSQTGVTCGVPSSRIVATAPKFLPRKSCACSSVSFATSVRLATMGQAILVGTRKGLSALPGAESRREWTVDDPLLPGWDVFHAIKHEDDLYVAANNWV